MDWSSIIVAIVTGGLAFLGVCVSNRKSGALTAYRIKQLEKKQDRYNNLQERTYKLKERAEVHEEKIKMANNRIADLEKKVDGMNKFRKDKRLPSVRGKAGGR